MRIVPGQYIEAWNAVLFVDGVPAFYYPYYKRNLGPHANNLNFLPGYRSAYGPYLLGTYTWWLNDAMDGEVHADYRERRGVGHRAGLEPAPRPLGRRRVQVLLPARPGIRHEPEHERLARTCPAPFPKTASAFISAGRRRRATNLNVKALVNYQSDPLVLHDFFEGDYTENPQPNTFVEANKYWDNWSLDALTTPRVNDFFDQVERLPDVKLTGWRQQVFDTPVLLRERKFRRLLPPDAGRDEFAVRRHERAGVRLFRRARRHVPAIAAALDIFRLAERHAARRRAVHLLQRAKPGRAATNGETYRKVFNTGVDASFKSSQLWAGATNSLLDVDGLRHIIEPSVSYAFVPRPSTLPPQLPQFDSALPSLLLLPIQLPDYNDIDSIDSENVIRFGLRNTLQTKRDGELENLLGLECVAGLAAASERQPGHVQRPLFRASRSARARGSRWNRRRATTSTTAI